jgi:aminoglycoside 2''-phosphotransferase
VDEFFQMHFATRPLDGEFTTSLRHGDFGPTNILYDPQTPLISGVIDFGSAGLGDPAVDIAALIGPVSYGETFAELLMPTYPGVDALLERARFYAGTFALQEALWGLDHNDPNAFQHGMANYV